METERGWYCFLWSGVWFMKRNLLNIYTSVSLYIILGHVVMNGVTEQYGKYLLMNSCKIILEIYCLEMCDSVQYGRYLMVNWSNRLPPSSGWQNMSPKKMGSRCRLFNLSDKNQWPLAVGVLLSCSPDGPHARRRSSRSDK